MPPSWQRGCERDLLFLAQPPFDRLPRAKEEKLVKASPSKVLCVSNADPSTTPRDLNHRSEAPSQGTFGNASRTATNNLMGDGAYPPPSPSHLYSAEGQKMFKQGRDSILRTKWFLQAHGMRRQRL